MSNLVTNPNAGKFILPTGYLDLGWQITTASSPEKMLCWNLNHSRMTGEIKEFDNSSYMCRCTDVVTICSVCKIAYHTDMSD
jgi:hypothetical protein